MAITYTTMNQTEELVHFRVEELNHTLIILLKKYGTNTGQMTVVTSSIDNS